jgi:hypothetical protein
MGLDWWDLAVGLGGTCLVGLGRWDLVVGLGGTWSVGLVAPK